MARWDLLLLTYCLSHSTFSSYAETQALDKTLVEWLHGYSADKKQQIKNKSLLKKYFTFCIDTKVDFFPLIRWFWADPILITFKGQIF